MSAQNINTDSSKVEFSITKHKKHIVEGFFKGIEGLIVMNNSNLLSLNVCIDPATVNTLNKSRDAHLRNPDYFDVKNYPSICFVSDSITQTDTGFVAIGTMSMLGVSKKEHIPLQISDYTLHGEFMIDRYDYDLGDEGTSKIGREVALRIYCVFTIEEE